MQPLGGKEGGREAALLLPECELICFPSSQSSEHVTGHTLLEKSRGPGVQAYLCTLGSWRLPSLYRGWG